MIELQGNSVYRWAYTVKRSLSEQIGGTYYRQGDYFLPNIAVPESVPIGVWGRAYYNRTKSSKALWHKGLRWFSPVLLSNDVR